MELTTDHITAVLRARLEQAKLLGSLPDIFSLSAQIANRTEVLKVLKSIEAQLVERAPTGRGVKRKREPDAFTDFELPKARTDDVPMTAAAAAAAPMVPLEMSASDIRRGARRSGMGRARQVHES